MEGEGEGREIHLQMLTYITYVFLFGKPVAPSPC